MVNASKRSQQGHICWMPLVDMFKNVQIYYPLCHDKYCRVGGRGWVCQLACLRLLQKKRDEANPAVRGHRLRLNIRLLRATWVCVRLIFALRQSLDVWSQ